MTDEALNELGAHVEGKRSECVLGWEVAHGELNVTVTLASLHGFIEFLRDDSSCRFSTLVDITAVDYPNARRGSTWSTTCSACTGTSASG